MGSLKSCSTPLRTRHNQERKSWHRMGLEPSLGLLHVNFLVPPNIVLSITGLIFFFFLIGISTKMNRSLEQFRSRKSVHWDAPGFLFG